MSEKSSTDFTFDYLNRTRVQINSDEQEMLRDLQTAFSYQRKVFGNAQSFHSFDGTGTYSCISASYTIKKGLVLEIAKYMRDNGYTFRIDPQLKDLIQPSCHYVNKDGTLIQPHASFQYRDYQERAIRAAYKFGRGILHSPTSSGKSLILYGICSNIKEFGERTLIIVPRLQLVSQFFKEWTLEYGFKGAAIYSKTNPVLDPDARVIITNYQFLVGKGGGKRKDLELIKNGNFKAVIVDECHSIGESNSWISRFLQKLSCDYALGCTGTVPEEEKSKRWNIIGTLGPIIFVEHIHTLQERNQIAKIRIKCIQFEHAINTASEIPWAKNGGLLVDKQTREVLDSTGMFRAEYAYIEKHNFCNNYILRFVEKLKGNTVILVDHIAHAEYMYEHCSCENKYLITGSTKLEERNNLSELIDSKDGKRYVVIAVSSCFSTGISIKNISNLILCSHGKALTKIIQSLGRVLRKVKPDGEEEFGNLFDFSHNQMFAKKHFTKRCSLYKKFYKINPLEKMETILVPKNSQQIETIDSDFVKI